MRKIVLGVSCGVVIGIIDVIPMILMNLTWDANLSAFFHWTSVGFFIGVIEFKKIKGALKGLLVSVLAMFPLLLIVTPKTLLTYLPMSVSTVFFGLFLGYIIDKFGDKSN